MDKAQNFQTLKHGIALAVCLCVYSLSFNLVGFFLIQLYFEVFSVVFGVIAFVAGFGFAFLFARVEATIYFNQRPNQTLNPKALALKGVKLIIPYCVLIMTIIIAYQVCLLFSSDSLIFVGIVALIFLAHFAILFVHLGVMPFDVSAFEINYFIIPVIVFCVCYVAGFVFWHYYLAKRRTDYKHKLKRLG